MFWHRFRSRYRPRVALVPNPPRPWPVDPELSRRVIETRKQVGHTRKQLARHVLPDRKRRDKRAASRRKGS
jgi:hypothetical protein